MVANAERGEIDIVLGKKRRVLRPSYEAVMTIETLTGRSLRELAQMANAMTMPIATMAVVVAELIRAGAADDDIGGKQGEPEVWGKLIYEAGMPAIAARLTVVLTAALTGGATISGELKPVATTKGIATATGD
ncbi:GTA-gp10 family protein [Sphingomonas fennica]|uniref:Uncharacterized protein n=1 Tax=Edaphosphingomonas fennica TaxID=114404 RepID=A0A2T4HVW9_9SPHN|nr:hypothetical protein [Sphingomonas fennica]PTD19900.1 hypothetical protein CV103_11975 [Sphingomonas fennica]